MKDGRPAPKLQKSVVMGHESQHSHIITDLDYYYFNVERICGISKVKQSGEKSKRKDLLKQCSFRTDIEMLPSGEKVVKATLTKHKLLVHTTTLLSVADFFG
jgi:hypothetical protein